MFSRQLTIPPMIGGLHFLRILSIDEVVEDLEGEEANNCLEGVIITPTKRQEGEGHPPEVQGDQEEQEVLPPQEGNEMIPVGGRLKMFQNEWTFNDWSHSIVASGLGWKWKEGGPPRFKHFFQSPTPYLEEFVQDLLQKNVIKRVKSIKMLNIHKWS